MLKVGQIYTFLNTYYKVEIKCISDDGKTAFVQYCRDGSAGCYDSFRFNDPTHTRLEKPKIKMNLVMFNCLKYSLRPWYGAYTEKQMEDEKITTSPFYLAHKQVEFDDPYN